MKPFLCAYAAGVFLLMSLPLSADDQTVKPPVAKKVPKQITQHGETRTDNYFWLRDRTDPDTIPYLESENRYTEAVMKGTDQLQSKLYAEILSHIKETDLSVPVRRGDFFYYSRTEKGKQYPIYCRKPAVKGADGPEWSDGAKEEVLLDVNQLAEGHKYFLVGNFSVSPNQKMVAYSTDTSGDEVMTTYVKNLTTGKLLDDRITNSYYTLEWANDNKTFFYTILDEAKRPYKVFRHTLGVKEDALIYHETDQRYSLQLGKSRSKKYLFVQLGSALTSEVRFLDADNPNGDFEPVLPRQQGIEYDVEHHGDYFYIRTRDGAPDFRVVRAPVGDRSKAKWQEVLPSRPGIAVDNVDAFKNYLVVLERHQGLHTLRVMDLKTNAFHYIDFKEPTYTANPSGNAEYDTTLLRFSYASMVTPSSVYDYNMATRKRVLKKQTEVPGYDASQYQEERIYATAPDGVKVPISVVYKKGFVKNGKAPGYLYGYGSYGIPSDPSFSVSRLALLDRGFVCAIAHIRGGGDLGKSWHDAGKLQNKKNTFIDFTTAAEYLEKQKYTSADRMAIMGGSAGGLLMGAVTNMRPDLFRAVVAKVPFVDVMNTMSDATLPLTVSEYEEWGNPEADKKAFDYMKTYSPYENVEGKKAY
ncbi:MAG: S9 family peptidase, partial [Bryobacteraceae bacterium]